MDDGSRIAAVIRQIANKRAVNITEGDVVAVNTADDTCTVDIDGIEMDGIRLRATPEEAGGRKVVLYPTIGSSVLVAMPSGSSTDAAVIQWSEVDKIVVGDGEQSVPNGTELKSQLEKLTKRVQALYDAIAQSSPSSQESGYSTLKTKAATVTEKEDWSNIEDDKFLH